MIKTPTAWLATPRYLGVTILDPDGWRHNDGRNWDDAITEDEFENRLMQCTCIFAPGFFEKVLDSAA